MRLLKGALRVKMVFAGDVNTIASAHSFFLLMRVFTELHRGRSGRERERKAATIRKRRTNKRRREEEECGLQYVCK